MKFNLANKEAVITGAASGIGKAIATTFAQQGATVHLVDLDKQKLKILSKTIEDNGGKAISHLCDVQEENNVQKIFESIHAMDVLINNAGVGITGPLEEIPITEIEKHFKTNLYGPINLIKTVLPYMRKNNSGLIINITSIAGHIGTPFRSIYSSGKSSETNSFILKF